MKGEDTTTETIDFRSLYNKCLESSHFKQLPPTFWAERTSKFDRPSSHSTFASSLIPKLEYRLKGCKSLLDVGCGSGEILSALHGVPMRIGIDSSQEMVKMAKEKLGEGSRVEHLSWEDSWDNIPEVDAVLSIRSLQSQDIGMVVSQMMRKARKLSVIVTRCKSHLSDSVQSLIPFNINALPPTTLLFGVFEEKGFYPEIEYIETNKVVDISTEETRRILRDDIIRRVNGVNWTNELTEALSLNIEHESSKHNRIECSQRWVMMTIKK